MKFIVYIVFGVFVYFGFYLFGNSAIDAAKKVELAQVYYLRQNNANINEDELRAKVSQLALKFDLYSDKGLFEVLQNNSLIKNLQIKESNAKPGVKLVSYSFLVDDVNRVEFDFYIMDRSILPKRVGNPFEGVSAKFITADDLRVYVDDELLVSRVSGVDNGMDLGRDDKRLLGVLVGLYAKDPQKALVQVRKIVAEAPKSNKKVLAEIHEAILRHEKKDSFSSCFSYGLSTMERLNKEVSDLEGKPVEPVDFMGVYESCKIQIANSTDEWKEPITESMRTVAGRVFESSKFIAIFEQNQQTEFPVGYFTFKEGELAAKVRQACPDKNVCSIASAKVSSDVRLAMAREANEAFGRFSSYAIDWYLIKDISPQ